MNTRRMNRLEELGRVGLSKGSGFPDFSGDGKITMKDILMGRGVFKSGGIAKRGRGCEIR